MCTQWLKEEKQRQSTFQEAGHEIVFELAGTVMTESICLYHQEGTTTGLCFDEQSQNQDCYSRDMTYRGPVGPASSSGFAIAALWGSWGQPKWPVGSCALDFKNIFFAIHNGQFLQSDSVEIMQTKCFLFILNLVDSLQWHVTKGFIQRGQEKYLCILPL